ncbi:hypothetical protein [Streptomyces niveus]|uniref:hypothetical protein n=1 Tax=Streptomyces niveus TaxID=193462 RepID=UPI0036D32783
MSDDLEPQSRASGCPPHEFGNALAWKWTREMPTPLKGGFLTLLYAMRAMASASGQMRFSGDGKPIRIQDIAKAAGCREKDARRYLEAAIRAGVVVTIGDRRRGKATLYTLVLCPWPEWAAAADYLKSTARPRKVEDEGSGHSGPNSVETEVQATEARTDEEGNRATAARMGSGRSGPNGSGHSGPNNPGSNHELHQEMAEVVPQPQERAGEGPEDDSPEQQEDSGPASRSDDSADDVAARFCSCGLRIIRADRERCAGCLRAEAEAQKPVQGAFLLPLAGGGQGVPQSRRERPKWPVEDPASLLRVCGCGREHRLPDSDRCPDCVLAAEEQRMHLEAVGGA